MNAWMYFECAVCHEPFAYDPSPQLQQRVRELELRAGKPFELLVQCPHCSEPLLIDREVGATQAYAPEAIDQQDLVGGVIWDNVLTEQTKDRVDALNQEGHILMEQGQPVAARQKFEEAVNLRKREPLSWYNLGVSLIAIGEAEAALAALGRATEYNPQFAPAWNNQGTLLFAAGQLDAAAESFDRGIAADPTHPKCYLGRGNVCVYNGDIAGARRYYEQALEQDPTYQKARDALHQLDLFEQGMESS